MMHVLFFLDIFFTLHGVACLPFSCGLCVGSGPFRT